MKKLLLRILFIIVLSSQNCLFALDSDSESDSGSETEPTEEYPANPTLNLPEARHRYRGRDPFGLGKAATVEDIDREMLAGFFRSTARFILEIANRGQDITPDNLFIINTKLSFRRAFDGIDGATFPAFTGYLYALQRYLSAGNDFLRQTYKNLGIANRESSELQKNSSSSIKRIPVDRLALSDKSITWESSVELARDCIKTPSMETLTAFFSRLDVSFAKNLASFNEWRITTPMETFLSRILLPILEGKTLTIETEYRRLDRDLSAFRGLNIEEARSIIERTLVECIIAERDKNLRAEDILEQNISEIVYLLFLARQQQED